jgi:hypothetical protein
MCMRPADQLIAAPGAALNPAALIKHVKAKHKRSGKPAAEEDVASDNEDDDELDQNHMLNKRKADAHWVDQFFTDEDSTDVSKWTLVAKELLTVRCHPVLQSLLNICCSC